MSDQTPPENPSEPTVPLESGAEPTQPIEPAAPAAPTQRGRGRAVLITVVALVVATLVGGGAWAAYSFFFGGGPRPDTALPASTIAVVSVDLNPSGGQKISAIKTIRRFPELRKNLGLGTKDDVRKWLFEKITDGTDCDGLDFADDVKPWIGDRAAFAAVDLGDDEPAPALAIQVTDQGKAGKGLDKIVECADFGDDFGYAIGDDYAIASDSTSHAKEILAAGRKEPLADDKDYQRWTDEVGDQGVLSFFVSKKAGDFISDALDEILGSFGEGFEEGFEEELQGGSGLSRAARDADEDCGDDPLASVRSQLDDFQGLAGTVRFADGGMELAVATGGVDQVASKARIGDKVGRLPKDTTLALGVGIPDDYAEKTLDGFRCGAGASGEDLVSQAERELGVDLPEDLQALLGSGLSLSLGGDAPASLEGVSDPADLPAGLLLHGDAGAIRDVIAKIEKAFDVRLSDIPIAVEGEDDVVALSPSEDYASTLLESGSLGSDPTFKDAVPNASRASSILYVKFDSEWRDSILSSLEDEFGASAEDARKAEENTEPLKALGFSAWGEGGTAHLLLKLTTR